MQPNPALKKLGFAPDDRVVILHADDIGMCQSTITAYSDLIDFGLMSSAAVMVPCPWFPSVAAYCRQHPEADLGIHLTLTCEWDVYRWGPISTADPESGLLDAEGYLHRGNTPVYAHAQVSAVAREIAAQVDRAQAAGISPTHMDTHMGTLAHSRFVGVYTQAAIDYRLPLMSFRWAADRIQRERGLGETDAQTLAQSIAQMEEQGIPLLDHIVGMPLSGAKPVELAQKILGDLQPGLTDFVFHPAQDTQELRAIAPVWAARVADYELFTSEEVRAFIREQGIQVIGYRPLRDLMRQ